MARRPTTGRGKPAQSRTRATGRGGRGEAPALSKAEQQLRQRLAKEIAKQQRRKEESQKARGVPYRFFVPRGKKAELIICDEAVEFGRYEHNYIGESGKRDQYCACLQESEICPVCKAIPDSRAYLGMFLTVIDTTGYTNGQGEHIPFTKKLLVIKSQQQDKWNRRIDAHRAKYGTLRGALVDVFRSDGETSPATGDDIEFIGHEDLDTEEAAETYVREYKDREGKLHIEDLREVVDYNTVFEEPTVEELEEMFGVEPPAGSDRANRREQGKANRRTRDAEYEEEESSSVKWDKQDRGNRPSRGRPTQRSEEPTRRRPVRRAKR